MNLFYNLRAWREATGPAWLHPGPWKGLLTQIVRVLCTLVQRGVKIRDIALNKVCLFVCFLTVLSESHPFNLLVTYGLTFFLKLIFEQIYFVAAILTSQQAILPIPWNGRPSVLGKCILISSPTIRSEFSALRPLLSGVFFFFFSLQLLLKKQIVLNCILYTSQGSGFIIHQTLGNLFWNISHSFSIGFPVLGGKTAWSSGVFNSLF